MMAINPLLVLCLNLLALVSSQSDGQNFQGSSEKTPRPRGSLVSDLGKLFENLDEAFYRITAPKVELETNFEEQKRNSDPIRNYFDRVRENYKSLQNKIGSTLESDGSFNIPNLFDVNYQNKGLKSAVGVSLPFLPLNIQVNSNNSPKKTDEKEHADHNIPGIAKEFQNAESSKVYDTKESKNTDYDRKDILMKDSTKTANEFQKRSSKHPKFPRQSINDNYSGQRDTGIDSPKISDQSEMYSPENVPLKQDAGIQGRVLGDILYSESTFDKYFRRLLKNFKWLVNPTAFPPKEIIENIRDVTSQFSAAQQNTGSKNSASTSKTNLGSKSKIHSINRKDTEQLQQADFAGSRQDDFEVILAFTPEGMPLKLKIESRSKNALRFLHEALSAAEVSLNIPIEDHKNLQPVGGEVLQLGTVKKGREAQVLYVDTTNSKQLKSLLKSLRRLQLD